jgi:NADH-quinone oxidoreductase subunit G
MFAARELVKKQGGSMLEGRQTGLAYDVSSLAAVAFNTGIANLETADVILLVGSDLRHEAPLINTRVQKAIRKRQAKVFAIGPETDLTYKAEWLGTSLKLLASCRSMSRTRSRPLNVRP